MFVEPFNLQAKDHRRWQLLEMFLAGQLECSVVAKHVLRLSACGTVPHLPGSVSAPSVLALTLVFFHSCPETWS